MCKKELTNPAIIETGYVFDYTCIYNYLEKSHIIVSKKLQTKQKDEEDDNIYSEDESEDENIENEKKEEAKEKRMLLLILTKVADVQ